MAESQVTDEFGAQPRERAGYVSTVGEVAAVDQANDYLAQAEEQLRALFETLADIRDCAVMGQFATIVDRIDRQFRLERQRLNEMRECGLL